MARFAAVTEKTYSADQAEDGTWTIRNVPIFAEVPKGERNNDAPIGKAWMLRAIEKANQRKSEGYTPPLHIHHHGTDKTTARAGSFKLRRVGSIKHDGKKVDALFADLTGVPDYEFQRIKAGELPYRSVEVFNWDEPEINSLALLDDEVPFFRFPNLNVREAEQDRSLFPNSGHLPTGSPALGFVAGSTGAAYLFRFQQETDPMTTLTNDERFAALEAEIAALKAKAMDKDEKEDLEEDDKKDDAKAKAAEEDDDEEEEDNKSPAEPSKTKGKAKAKASAVPAADLIALQSEVLALRDKFASREKAEQATALVASTIDTDLDGYDISPETRSHFKALAEMSPALFTANVAIYKATAERDPPATIGGATFSAESDAPEVAAYAQQGPDALAAARQHAKDFPKLKACGIKSTLSQFLAANVGVKE